MKYYFLYIFLILFLNPQLLGQNYTSYFTGSSSDISTITNGGICLMGGASEDDNAMSWFLQKANGGDILVLRASGSDGYNNYMYTGLGVNVNSVETIVFNNSSASNEIYILQKIQQAEAIWFAGGDQWDYVSYWRNSPVDSLINEAIANRNIVIGGTSAGMAILGGFYFSAQNGTVTSSTALSNPYNNNITVDSSTFIFNQIISDVITDTHYDDPDRKGRHVVFLSRILTDYGIIGKGIACDEYTAVCIDNNGIASVYGEYPNYDDNAYFIQPNCELIENNPENCNPNNPLDWNLGNEAIKVYAVKGTINGANSFDLNNWETGIGGSWENWYVDNGTLYQQSSIQPNCNTISISKPTEQEIITIAPNPANKYTIIKLKNSETSYSLKLINSIGQIQKQVFKLNSQVFNLETSRLPSGLYFIEITFDNNKKLIKKLSVL